MLAKLLSFSQSKLVVIDGDTLCLTSIESIKKANKIFANEAHMTQLNDSLVAQIGSYNEYLFLAKEGMRLDDKQMYLQGKVITEQKTMLNNDQDIQKKLNNKIWWVKTQRNVLALVVVAAAVKIFIVH